MALVTLDRSVRSPAHASQFLHAFAPIRPFYRDVLSDRLATFLFLHLSLRGQFQTSFSSGVPGHHLTVDSLEHHKRHPRAHQTACRTHVRTTPATRIHATGSNRDVPAVDTQGSSNWERESRDQGTEGDTKRRHVHRQWERKSGYSRIHDQSMLGGLKRRKALLTLRQTIRKETCVGKRKFRSHGTVLENDLLGTSVLRLGD